MINSREVGRSNGIVRAFGTVALGELLREGKSLPPGKACGGQESEREDTEESAFVVGFDPVHEKSVLGGRWLGKIKEFESEGGLDEFATKYDLKRGF